MKEVVFSDAKARLSRVVDDAKAGEPSVITRHGRKEAVVVSYETWLKATEKPSLWKMLMDAPVEDGDLVRNPSKFRPVDF